MSVIPKIINGQISRAHAIEFLAEILFPEENKRVAEKRIREKIRYHEKKKQIRFHSAQSPDQLEAAPFFDWAKERWSSLRNRNDLPTQPNNLSGEITLPFLTSSGLAIAIPNDLEEAQEKYEDAMILLNQCQIELCEGKNRITDLESELNKLQKKNELTRAKRSAAGKKGKDAPRTKM